MSIRESKTTEFGIVRIDEYQPSGPRDELFLPINMTVVCFVDGFEFAKAEVERLNELNADKRCHYYLTYARHREKK